MAILSLPLPDKATPKYLYNIVLDNIEYVIKFNYSTRNLSWYLSLELKDETLLITNVRMVPYIDLLTPYTRELLPEGQFIIYANDNSYPSSPVITLENLSTEFQFLYVTE